jgi:DNA end-binding protein Ku
MATGSRTLWKGAITFGLVHIPIGLHSATEEGRRLRLARPRTMDPVGYKRINKRTGKRDRQRRRREGRGARQGQLRGADARGDRRGLVPAAPRPSRSRPSSTSPNVPFVYLERPYYTRRSTRARRSTRCCARRCATPARRPRQGGDPHQAAPGGAGAHGAGAGAEPAALGRRGAVLGRTSTCPPEAQGRPAETRRTEDGAPADRRHERPLERRRPTASSFHDAITKLVEAKAKAGKTETVEPLEEAPEAGRRGDRPDRAAAAQPEGRQEPEGRSGSQGARQQARGQVGLGRAQDRIEEDGGRQGQEGGLGTQSAEARCATALLRYCATALLRYCAPCGARPLPGASCAGAAPAGGCGSAPIASVHTATSCGVIVLAGVRRPST